MNEHTLREKWIRIMQLVNPNINDARVVCDQSESPCGWKFNAPRVEDMYRDWNENFDTIHTLVEEYLEVWIDEEC